MNAAFNTLDHETQTARLEKLARETLNTCGLTNAGIALVYDTNNAVFRVTHPTGTFALRIHRPGHKRLAWIRSELAWLKALRQDTGLRVPEPAADVVIAASGSDEAPVYCALFRWLEGRSVETGSLTHAQARAVGTLAARLHEYASRFVPPAGFERPRLDWEGLFGERSPYNPGAGSRLFTRDQQGVMDAVARRVRSVMEALDSQRNAFGLIHADLIAKNLIFDGDTVGAIDFDDCGTGYYLYDLAPLLWTHRQEAGYADLREALWQGYTAVRALPDDQRSHLEAFVAARHVASCRWVAGNAEHPAWRDRARTIIAARVEEMSRFLETGFIGAES